MQVFYVNIGGGEPTVRPDFWELVDYATAHRVGVKFSTNGVRITPAVAERLGAWDYGGGGGRAARGAHGRRARRRVVRDRRAGAGAAARGRDAQRQDLGRLHPAQRGP